jgi:hypothetical protein
MTIETPLPASRVLRLRSRSTEALRELPTRRPQPAAEAGTPIQWELVDLDRYAVRDRGRVVGFIDVVGAVFVALGGTRYYRATELLQTLDFDTAIAALCRAGGGDDA